jgi:hypothetical protein
MRRTNLVRRSGVRTNEEYDMSIQAGAMSTDGTIAVPVSFLATNITGTQSVPIEVNGGLTVGSVTESIADRMALPNDVAWALRDDDSSAYLDDNKPIGSQISPGSRVTITPKTHLGGGELGA